MIYVWLCLGVHLLPILCHWRACAGRSWTVHARGGIGADMSSWRVWQGTHVLALGWKITSRTPVRSTCTSHMHVRSTSTSHMHDFSPVYQTEFPFLRVIMSPESGRQHRHMMHEPMHESCCTHRDLISHSVRQRPRRGPENWRIGAK